MIRYLCENITPILVAYEMDAAGAAGVYRVTLISEELSGVSLFILP